MTLYNLKLNNANLNAYFALSSNFYYVLILSFLILLKYIIIPNPACLDLDIIIYTHEQVSLVSYSIIYLFFINEDNFTHHNIIIYHYRNSVVISTLCAFRINRTEKSLGQQTFVTQFYQRALFFFKLRVPSIIYYD